MTRVPRRLKKLMRKRGEPWLPKRLSKSSWASLVFYSRMLWIAERLAS